MVLKKQRNIEKQWYRKTDKIQLETAPLWRLTGVKTISRIWTTTIIPSNVP